MENTLYIDGGIVKFVAEVKGNEIHLKTIYPESGDESCIVLDKQDSLELRYFLDKFIFTKWLTFIFSLYKLYLLYK